MALLRALAATLVFVVALGVANAVSLVAGERFGWPGLVRSLVQAVLCTVITLVGITGLGQASGVRPPWYGLRRAGAWRDVGSGFAVVAVAAGAVVAVAAVAGRVRVAEVDLGLLVLFLLSTAVVATGLEAFPEELAFRGMAYSSLRSRAAGWVAVAGSTLLFVLAPGASTVVSAALVRLMGSPLPIGVSLAPGGANPVDYLVFLVLWSLCLTAARLVTGSIWTAVGAHLLMLVVNRLLIGASDGLRVDLAGADQLVILPAYVLLAALGFVLLRRRRTRRAGRRG